MFFSMDVLCYGLFFKITELLQEMLMQIAVRMLIFELQAAATWYLSFGLGWFIFIFQNLACPCSQLNRRYTNIV